MISTIKGAYTYPVEGHLSKDGLGNARTAAFRCGCTPEGPVLHNRAAIDGVKAKDAKGPKTWHCCVCGHARQE